MRDIADESFAYADSKQDAEGLGVRFELRPVRDNERSKAEGRPVFADTEYIEIRVPGDKDSIIHRPATARDRARFAATYRRWKAAGGGEVQAVGTPLSEWASVSRSQVEELAFFNVRTVEQLAAVSDGNLKGIGPLLALREKARAFVKTAKDGAPVAQLREELEASRREAEVMRRQMAELMAAVNSAAPAEKPAKKTKTEA